MKFSIIISCFNNSRFLPSCIKTALRNAENKDVEIICVESVGTDSVVRSLKCLNLWVIRLCYLYVVK